MLGPTYYVAIAPGTRFQFFFAPEQLVTMAGKTLFGSYRPLEDNGKVSWSIPGGREFEFQEMHYEIQNRRE